MAKAIVAHSVAIPDSDPIYGSGGPLVDMWTEAATSTSAPGAVKL